MRVAKKVLRELLLRYQEDHYLSNKDMAVLLDVAKYTYARWRSGRAAPFSLAKLKSVCRTLGVNCDDLLIRGIIQDEISTGRFLNLDSISAQYSARCRNQDISASELLSVASALVYGKLQVAGYPGRLLVADGEVGGCGFIMFNAPLDTRLMIVSAEDATLLLTIRSVDPTRKGEEGPKIFCLPLSEKSFTDSLLVLNTHENK